MTAAIIGNSAEQNLMRTIHEKWGTTIHDACTRSTVPEDFLAALVANESAGDENAKRFEKNVLAQLWQVLMGRAAAFGSIGRDDLLKFADPSPGFSHPTMAAFQRIDTIATSWGLTQIMGYEAIALQVPLSYLTLPERSLGVTLKMISGFAASKDLDVTKNSAELLDCWNTGRPHAPTADPQYIPNGLSRMQLYRAILNEPPKAVSA